MSWMSNLWMIVAYSLALAGLLLSQLSLEFGRFQSEDVRVVSIFFSTLGPILFIIGVNLIYLWVRYFPEVAFTTTF